MFRIETRPPLVLAGYVERYTSETRTNIPEQWARFSPYVDALPQQVGRAAYGAVVADGGDCGDFAYYCGVEVSSVDGLPNGFSVLEINAPRYAVFRHEGHPSAIAQTMQTVFQNETVRRGHDPSVGADIIERYGESFDPATGEGGFDILAPLRAEGA